MCRRKGNMDAPEEILLDLNKLAEGQKFLGLGAYSVSDDGNLLAFSTDTTGYRQYTLQVKDLRTGELLKEKIERAGSVVWATDNKTVFYSTEDPVSKRSDKIWRHAVGADSSDVVYEEKDEQFDVSAGRSLDRSVIFIASYAKTSREFRYLPANEPLGTFRVVLPREAEHEYDVDHYKGAFLHYDQSWREEFPSGHRADVRSVREELEAFHRSQPRGQDRQPVVLRRSPRRVGA